MDVENFYKDSSNDDLKNYTSYGYNFMFNNAYNQIVSKYKDIELNDDFKKMGELESKMNVAYFMGEALVPSEDELKDFDQYSDYIQSTLKYLETEDLKTSGTLK